MSHHGDHGSSGHETARSWARALGLFSIGLGLNEWTAAGGFANMFGMDRTRPAFKAYGAREIATGVGLLAARQNPAPWLWGRVAGDVLDLATLAPGLKGPKRDNVIAGMMFVGGVLLLDLLAARQAQAATA